MVENLGIGKLYENKGGAFFVQCFFSFLFFIFMEYCLRASFLFVSSPELAQDELLGYRDVRRTCGRP